MKMRSAIIVIASLIMASLFSLSLPASSPDAWQQFRQAVEDKCLNKAEQILTDITIVVDPYGSEQHGVAIVFGAKQAASKRMAYVCLYHKQSKDAELYVGASLDELTR